MTALNHSLTHSTPRADPGFLKRGVHLILRSTRKGGGGGRRGSNFGPNVKKPTTWAKKGVRTPPPPLPGSAHETHYWGTMPYSSTIGGAKLSMRDIFLMSLYLCPLDFQPLMILCTSWSAPVPCIEYPDVAEVSTQLIMSQ